MAERNEQESQVSNYSDDNDEALKEMQQQAKPKTNVVVVNVSPTFHQIDMALNADRYDRGAGSMSDELYN